MAIRSYRYRIYPSKRQTRTLNDQLAICCELYNAALTERREAWRRERKSISFSAQSAQLPEIKRERVDVGAVYSQVLQDVLHRLDKTFQSFFRRVKTKKGKAGFPRYRAPARYESLTYPQFGFTIERCRLKVSNVGNLKIGLHRPINGTIQTLTIKREAGRWFAIFACDVEPAPLPFNPNTVGIDLGLTTFAALSDGGTIENPRHYRQAERKLRVAQRRVARRKRGSNRRRKAVLLLQRIHAHVKAQRADFLHKQSRNLINEYGLIAVEDLNVKGLASGMLAKSVHDAAWGQFLNYLSYKAEDAGRVIVRVNPAGTSQTCTCGAEVRKTLAQRWHLCLSCGLSADRDHVSAQVILQRAVSLSGINVEVVNSCVA